MIKNIEKNDLLFAIKKLNFADISYIIKNLQRVYDCYDKFIYIVTQEEESENEEEWYIYHSINDRNSCHLKNSRVYYPCEAHHGYNSIVHYKNDNNI